MSDSSVDVRHLIHLAQDMYEADGRLKKDSDPAGGFKTLTRTGSPNNYTVAMTSALGRTTTYGVASNNGAYARNITLPSGLTHAVNLAVDGTSSVTQADGTHTTITLLPDPRFGLLSPLNVVSTALPSGLTSTQSESSSVVLSDPNNPLSLVSQSSTTNNNGRATTTVFSAATKTYTTTSPAGRVTTRTIDAKGRTTRLQVGGLTAVDMSYDPQGHLATVTQGSRVNLNQYFPSGAAAGYLQSSTDPLSQTTNYTRDALGRVLTETLAGIATGTTWDPAGNLKTVTPPGKPVHSLNYTPVDLVSEYDPPAASLPNSAASYTYDVDRALTSTLRPDGQSIGLTYDSAGRADITTIPGGSIDHDYFGASPPAGGAAGKLSALRGPYGVNLGFSHDGQLLKGTTWSGAVVGSVGWTFDSDFVRIGESVTGSTGSASAVFGYDLDKLLTCASRTDCNPPSADALKLTRSPANGLATSIALSSVTETIGYNAFGELASQVAVFGSTTLLSEAYDAPGHTRDSLGRITRKTEVINGITTEFDYLYDTRNRLSDVFIGGVLNEHYTYDGNGNRLGVTSSGGTVAASYDDQDRLLTNGTYTYTYTANGELETKTNTSTSQSTLYDYDVLGNLLSVSLPKGTLIEYLVDGQGRRVGKKVNGALVKRWLYSDQLRPVAELDGAGALLSEFVYGSRPNVPDFVVRGGVVYRVLSDQLGSLRLVVNATTGAVAQRMRHDAWGKVLEDSSPGFVPFGFAGGLYDADTGLVRFGARDYDAAIGRWVSKDPVRFDAAGANLYGYVLGDPVNLTDPNGQHPILVFLGICAAGGCEAAAAAAVGVVAGVGALAAGIACELDPECSGAVDDLVDGICRPLPDAWEARKKRSICTCQHRDFFSSNGQSCQALRETGICGGPYKGTGTDQASCQASARANAGVCGGCVAHCQYMEN